MSTEETEKGVPMEEEDKEEEERRQDMGQVLGDEFDMAEAEADSEAAEKRKQEKKKHMIHVKGTLLGFNGGVLFLRFTLPDGEVSRERQFHAGSPDIKQKGTFWSHWLWALLFPS